MRPKHLAVIGSTGMLGSDLVRFFSKDFQVTGIHREDYQAHVGETFDIIVNANGNSKRFWANEHPLEDFIASTESVYKSIFDFKYRIVYVYISSSDVYNDHTGPRHTKEDASIMPDALSSYGLHKYFSELLIQKYVKQYLILRSSMMLGTNLKKGPLFDVIHHAPLYISRDSRLQMITTQEIADIIRTLIDKKVTQDVFNIGGIGTFSFRSLDQYIPGPHVYRPDAEKQMYEMRIEKIQKIYPLKTSEEYLREFLHGL